MSWEGLTPPYATIVADPPWQFDHNGGSGGPTATPRPARDTDSIARRRRVLDALARLGRAA